MPDANSCPALILAPAGRDAGVASALLGELDVASIICRNVDDLAMQVGDDVSCTIATEEALSRADLRALSEWVASQPAWSDLPFIVLTHKGGAAHRGPEVSRLSGILGNVTFIERPFHPITFVSVVGTAIRGRHRQFEARSRIEELREGEARLHTALTAGHLGSWELDLSTRTLTTSPTCRAIFGYTEADFSYRTLLESVHPEDQDRMRAALTLSVDTGCDYEIEYRNVWPDGSVHWVDIRARFVSGEGVKPDRLVGVSSDVTGRKTSEDALRRLNESLESKVIERTAELQTAHRNVLEEIRQREQTEELLRQIQKLEMIGQLSGGIAHDFNNLLMTILANLELARKEVANGSKTLRLIEGAFRGAQRGAALTQRLLAFARQQDLKVEPVRMSSLITGMADLLERSIGSAIELRIETGSISPVTILDANQVELAVLNLVVNARDAMPDGGTLTISIDTVRSPGTTELNAGEYVRVTVADTGFGMDEATLAKATEPFFTTKEVGKGTGLGLSMIHGLAQQLNGALRLESAPGCGTRASLWLPVSERAVSELDAGPAVEASDNDTQDSAVILVVDDDPLVATSTAYLLEDLGHKVVEAESGDAALGVLRNGVRVDLLLTDYSMPRMTGLELATAARELRPGLPVILATGYAELPRGAGTGIPQLRKPYQQQQLMSEIRKALSYRLV